LPLMMLLFPKRTKYKKYFSRYKVTTLPKVRSRFFIGDFSLVALEPGHVTSRQIESVRRLLRRLLKKQARIWISVFPNLPITKKPQETRMGKGKGSTKYWVATVRPEQQLFEIKGCNFLTAQTALSLAKTKLSIKSRILQKSARWVL
jgi:large subunit ribosomal protein L16